MTSGARLLLFALVCGCRGPEFLAGGGGDDAGGGPTGAGPVGGAEDGGGGNGAGPIGGNGGEGPVTVDVQFRDSNGGFMADRTAMLADEDGATLEMGTLDEDGRITFEALPTDMIYVFDPGSKEDPDRNAYGAEVTSSSTEMLFVHQVGVRQDFGDVTVQVNCSSCTGATEAVVSLSCEPPKHVASPGSSFQVTFYNVRGCPGETEYDASVVARNATTVVAYGFFSGLAGTFVGLTAQVDDVQNVDWTVSNLAAGFELTRTAEVFLIEPGLPVGMADVESEAETVTVPFPEVVDDPVRVGIEAFDEDGRFIFQRRTFTTFDEDTLTNDAASLALPDDVTDFTVSAIDPATFSWTLGDGPLGDAVLTSMSEVAPPGDTTGVVAWAVVRPAARAGTMRLPDLGAELVDYAIPIEETVATVIANFDDAGAANYAEALAGGTPPDLDGQGTCEDCNIALDLTFFTP